MSKNPARDYAYQYLLRGVNSADAALIAATLIAAAAEPTGDPLGDIDEAALGLVTVTPAQLTADADDWDGTGDALFAFARASSDASRTITGLVAPTTERLVILANVGAEDIVLAHQDASSAAANQLLCASATDVTLAPDAAVFLVYDLDSAGWRVVGGTGGGGPAAPSPTDWTYIIDGGAAVLTTGIRPVARIPWDCTVTAARAYADQNGNLQIDVLRTTHASYDTPSTHPVAADSMIGAGTDITISSADKYEDTSLDWDSVDLLEGDLVAFNIVGTPATIRKVSIVLTLVPV